MRKVYAMLLSAMLLCIGCEWQWRTSDDERQKDALVVERYDRIQSLYLTTGDYSALQRMNTDYPMQTRTLIEDVLCIGRVNEREINTKFLHFFQDTTLQSLIADVERQYVEMDDVSHQLSESFARLQKMIPGLLLPEVYAQITSLDQSIVVGDGLLGISLDKYLGADYPLYLKYGYSERQRKTMTRAFIVPDCLGFYLLSLYPMPADRELTQHERDLHIGKIQWVVNRAMGKPIFDTEHLKTIEEYMKNHKAVTPEQLLQDNNYSAF